MNTVSLSLSFVAFPQQASLGWVFFSSIILFIIIAWFWPYDEEVFVHRFFDVTKERQIFSLFEKYKGCTLAASEIEKHILKHRRLSRTARKIDPRNVAEALSKSIKEGYYISFCNEIEKAQKLVVQPKVRDYYY